MADGRRIAADPGNSRRPASTTPSRCQRFKRPAFTLQVYGHVLPGMDADAAATVADLILGGTPKGPGTVVPDPSANKSANNGPQSDAPIEEVKDERPVQ